MKESPDRFGFESESWEAGRGTVWGLGEATWAGSWRAPMGSGLRMVVGVTAVVQACLNHFMSRPHRRGLQSLAAPTHPSPSYMHACRAS